jgi:hypothetical protein
MMFRTIKRRLLLPLALLIAAAAAPPAAAADWQAPDNDKEAFIYVTNRGTQSVNLSLIHNGREHRIGRVEAMETKRIELPMSWAASWVQLASSLISDRSMRLLSDPIPTQAGTYTWEIIQMPSAVIPSGVASVMPGGPRPA